MVREKSIPYENLLEELIELIQDDAEALNCKKEIDSAFDILQRGTSAHRQVKTYQQALTSGSSEAEALCQVVDMLITETTAGI